MSLQSRPSRAGHTRQGGADYCKGRDRATRPSSTASSISSDKSLKLVRPISLPRSTTRSMLKIIDAKVIVTCPGRNFVTLKITTEDGITGVGDATLNGRELSVVSFLQDHMIPSLIGRDAHQIEDIWQFFYRGSYWRGGPGGPAPPAPGPQAPGGDKGQGA